MSFIKQASFSVDYAPALVTKWRLSHSGLQLTYINQPLPMVNGYFAVATEIDNDLGCPHTLEHLVFMGSKKYPYKGLLDVVGSRLFSQTNAWTLVDQTVYTLTLAGWHGFRLLLPVYLDHLLHPTIEPEACVTEVYHIDGNGKEKGVVFSEMQGIETLNWFVTYLSMQRNLYPPKLGYLSETGGLMLELRTLSRESIIQFHQQMYRPDNLCVIITGSVNEDELLATMEEFDRQLPKQVPHPRPFVDSAASAIEPLVASSIHRVEFPDKDESMGELLISWVGPTALELLVNVAIDSVGAYFSDLPISVLNKQFVEIADPWATDVDYSTDDFVRTVMSFTMNGVPTDKLPTLADDVKKTLNSHTNVATFDVDYMRQVLRNQKLKFISLTEKLPLLISNIAISEFLYGNVDGLDLLAWIKGLQEYDELELWTAQQWCDLIKRYFVDNHLVTILGYPSAKLNKELKLAEKQRAKDIKKKYGVDGLKKLQQQLDAAQAKNDTPIPDDLITLFAKPDPSKIEFIDTDSYLGGTWEGVVDLLKNNYLRDLALARKIDSDTLRGSAPFMHFEEYKLQFTTINVVMLLTAIEPQLLAYMLIIEEIFTMSMTKNGHYLGYNEVISQINDDLIEYQVDNGYENQFLELINIKIKFETHKYKRAIEWLRCVTQGLVFEPSRIKVIVEKLINLLPDKKRNSELMMYSSKFRNIFTKESLRRAQDPIETEQFFRNMLAALDNGDSQPIIDDLTKLTKQLFTLDNMKIITVGNIKDLEDPVSLWQSFVDGYGEGVQPQPFSKLPRLFQFKSELGKACSKQAFLIISPVAELTHFVSHAPMPTDYFHPDQAAIALALEFLATVEGPFWRAIRGTGLAYGALIRRNMETGLLAFSIYRGSDAKQAWIVAKELVESYASGKLVVDKLAVENAVATMVNELASGVENCYDAALYKIIDNLFKRRGAHYDKVFLKQLNQLTPKDIVAALDKYFVPLFEAKLLLIFTSIPPEKEQEFVDFFKGEGYNINIECVDVEAGEEEDDDEEGDSEDDSDEDDSEDEDSEEDSEDSETEWSQEEGEEDLVRKTETSDMDFGKPNGHEHHPQTDQAKRRNSEVLKPGLVH